MRGAVRRPVEVPYTFARRADGDSKATINQGLLVYSTLWCCRSDGPLVVT